MRKVIANQNQPVDFDSGAAPTGVAAPCGLFRLGPSNVDGDGMLNEASRGSKNHTPNSMITSKLIDAERPLGSHATRWK